MRFTSGSAARTTSWNPWAELIERIVRDTPPPPPPDIDRLWDADLAAARMSIRTQYMFSSRVINPHAILKVTSLGSGT